MAPTERARGFGRVLLWSSLALLPLAGLSGAGKPAHRSGFAEPAVLLRLTADSGLVGHYKFTMRESHRHRYDIPPDDPRAPILESTAGPWTRTTDVAVTILSQNQDPERERLYPIAWLGFRISGDEVRSFTGAQWDSIFRKVGRTAVLSFTPTGRPRGVQVTSEAVRPVGDALTRLLVSMPLLLPRDSVSEGARWPGNVSVPVRRPDGTRVMVNVELEFRLSRLKTDEEGLRALIDFDGLPVFAGEQADSLSGRYMGESVFSVAEGRYEELSARAELEVAWADPGELPPSRTVSQWQGEVTRR